MPIVLNGTTGITTPAQTLTSAALSTAVAGTTEWDGKVQYFTPQGTQRGVIPGEQLYVLNSGYVGLNSTAAQPIFGVGVTLSSSTYYAFEAVYALSKTTVVASHSLSILFGGTATLNSIAYQLSGQYNNSGFSNTTTTVGNFQPNFIQTASAFTVGSTSSSALIYYMVLVKGMVSVNAGGTFIPQYQCSAAPGSAYTTAANSYFKIYPIGASGANVSVGTWA